MYPDDPLHVCRDCPVPHYDNCPDCFGFGVYLAEFYGRTTRGFDKLVPVSAGQAMKGLAPDNAMPCPTCGSTVKGLPADKGA